MTFIGDADDLATVLEDARKFFFFSPYFAASDDAEASGIEDKFSESTFPPYWDIGGLTSALVQVYDLVAPLDVDLAERVIKRLGRIACALLASRDDYRGFPADAFRGRVMPAWGACARDRDCKWNTDVDTSGLFAYAMAAFARRVARNPTLHAQHGDDAVRFITATLETFEAFRPELHLVDSDPHAYFVLPLKYRELQCKGCPCPYAHSDAGNLSRCEDYRALAGRPLPYNQNLSMMKALAEVALAADSTLYRGSADATPQRLRVATEEVPLIVAKNVAFFADHLHLEAFDDGTPYFEWDYQQARSQIENTAHAQFELGCLAVILEDQVPLNALLARTGRSERLPSPSRFAPFANTFLRRVWRDDSLNDKVDGSGNKSVNVETAGWIPFSQFDPWVWRRSRDTTFRNTPSDLRYDNHAALLRYRKFNAMKFLTEFASQNWLITPAAAAVGETPPANIHDQRWLLVLSGVVIADLKGDNSGGWNRETVSFMPDMAGPDDPSATSGPLNWAISHYSIPKPAGSPGTQYLIRFSVEEWSPFVSLSAIFNQGQSINSGHAVDAWRPNHFGSGTDVLTGRPVSNLFSGVNVDLAVRDNDAWLFRLGYNVTLIGKIVFVELAF
jgi:hypothetical protein